MDSVSKDVINDLPDELLCHILSFLTTKEAASTAVLSRRWRYLLAFVPKLEFDDSVFLHPDKRVKNPLEEAGFIGFVMMVNDKRVKLSTSFVDIVDRILYLQGNSPLDKFSLKVVDDHDPVDPDCVISWIHKVLVRGLSDLRLVVDLNEWDSPLPERIFLSETLVKLTLQIKYGTSIDVEHVHLPKLKTLYLKSVMFSDNEIGFSKLLSGCHVLEELVLDHISSCFWDSCPVSVSTLKKLTFCCENMKSCYGDTGHEENPNSVSFDTPNVVYLEYAEVIANTYPKVNFDSLVEAKIDLWMTDDQIEEQVTLGNNEENYMVGNATAFVFGIRNVRVLYLSSDSLEVLTYCCNPIPVFNNLTHLTVESNPKVGLKPLPKLLKNSPKLETLVFQELLHIDTEEEDDVAISSSSVKVLKIFIRDDENIGKKIEKVKHFLETMPHLQQLVLLYDVKVSSQLQMLGRLASPKCKIHLIPSNL